MKLAPTWKLVALLGAGQTELPLPQEGKGVAGNSYRENRQPPTKRKSRPATIARKQQRRPTRLGARRYSRRFQKWRRPTLTWSTACYREAGRRRKTIGCFRILHIHPALTLGRDPYAAIGQRMAHGVDRAMRWPDG
mgnify:CR=1 FL=1